MDVDPGAAIDRAMIEDKDGLPVLGLTAVKLGVRRGIDIITDQTTMVHRPHFQPGAPNGLSCAPTIQDLPDFALPVQWRGSNPRTVIWEIDIADLGVHLVAQEDTPTNRKGRHVSVGPAGSMTFDEFLQAVQATRPNWRKTVKT